MSLREAISTRATPAWRLAAKSASSSNILAVRESKERIRGPPQAFKPTTARYETIPLQKRFHGSPSQAPGDCRCRGPNGEADQPGFCRTVRGPGGSPEGGLLVLERPGAADRPERHFRFHCRPQLRHKESYSR